MAFALETLPADASLPLPFYIRCELTAAGKLITISSSGVPFEHGDNTNKLSQLIDLKGDVVLIKGSAWSGMIDADERVASPTDIRAISAAFLWNEMCDVQVNECHVDIVDRRERSLAVLLEYDQHVLGAHIIYSVVDNGHFQAP